MFKGIKPFIVMDILKKASSIEGAYHLEIGEPDLPPSPKVLKTLKEIANTSNIGAYTEAKGLKTLREAISNHYKIFYNVDVDPDRIVITIGSSGGFSLVFGLLEKSNIALQDPGYPCYQNIAYAFNKNIKKINVDPSTDYQITPKHLENVDFDMLLISSVSNPTGVVYDNDNLYNLIEFCKSKNKVFVCDEIYHGLTYDKEIKTALYFDDVFVINSFSKFFCMPGFRIGWMVVPEKYIKNVERLSQNMFISAPYISQVCAVEAFDYDYLDFVRDTYKKRRDFLYGNLKDIFDIPIKPEGAFYVWADVSRYDEGGFRFCNNILETSKVAITPGIDFGEYKTKSFVRFSFAKDIEYLKDAIKSLKNML